MLGLAGGNASSIAPLTIDVGGSTTAVSTNGDVVTDSAEQRAVDVNLYGLADLQVAPTTASVSLDRSTGVVTPSCDAGVTYQGGPATAMHLYPEYCGAPGADAGPITGVALAPTSTAQVAAAPGLRCFAFLGVR